MQPRSFLHALHFRQKLLPRTRAKRALGCVHVAYDDLSPSSQEVRSTAMKATKNNVPPSSTLVIRILVSFASTRNVEARHCKPDI